MNKASDRAERSKTLEIARRYKSRGYVVRSSLSGRFTQSEKIRGFRPDIVAQKGGQYVIVEVKSRPSLKKSSHALKQFSKYVRANPNYTFELVVTNPSKAMKSRTRSKSAKKKKSKSTKQSVARPAGARRPRMPKRRTKSALAKRKRKAKGRGSR
jgi:Holliday junction resolvase